MKYGYAQVLTDGQSVGAQARQLAKAGCREVVREAASGAKTDRARLRRAVERLEPGDVLAVTRLDRLFRSTRDLFAIVKRIVDAKAHFRSLAEPWADTATSTGRLMIAALGGLADVERDLIRTRAAEGRVIDGESTEADTAPSMHEHGRDGDRGEGRWRRTPPTFVGR